MDIKGVQHCKHSKKMKSSKGNKKPEVFVLPPDILKKLGISIGNINVTQEITTNVSASQSNEILSNEHLTNISTPNSDRSLADTSILETAKLMKKSLFLSPTFIPMVGIPGEVEISSNKNTDSLVELADLDGIQSSICIPLNGTEVHNSFPVVIDTHEACCKVNPMKVNCDFEKDGTFTSVSNISQDNTHMKLAGSEILVPDVKTISNEFLHKEKSTHVDILDDKILSKNNNNEKSFSTTALNREALNIVSEINTNTVPSVQKLARKINIISEETIPLAKLRKFKSLQSSHKNSLTPVPFNTIIGSKNSSANSSLEATSTSENNPRMPLNKSKIFNEKSSNLESTRKSKVNLAANIPTSTATSDTSSQEAQDSSSKNAVNVFNINENISIQSSKPSCNVTYLDHSKTESNGTIKATQISGKETEFSNASNNQAINTNQLNAKHLRTLEENVSFNIVNDSGFDSNIDGFDERKCVDSVHIVSSDEINKDIKPEDNYIQNHHCTANLQDSEMDNFRLKVNDVKTESTLLKCNTIKGNLDSKSEIKVGNTCKRIDNSNSKIKQCPKDKYECLPSVKKIEDKLLQNDELSNILNATKDLSSSSPDVKIGKVKEIAAYLKKFSHIYTDKKRIRKELGNDRNKQETINSNTNKIKSKLCIQGVEKPGGNKIDRKYSGECKVLKTYARHNHSKPSKSPIVHTYKTCDTLLKTDIEHNTESITLSKLQEFCICHDFGRLAYYDYENLYEHIHFWEHVSTNCELDLIFAIYSDETIKNNNESELDQEQKTDENVATFSVCWNVYQNETCENVDIYGQQPNNFVIEESNNVFGETFKAELNPIAQYENNNFDSKTHNQAHVLTNNLNSDVILESVDHDMVDTADSKNYNHIKNVKNATCYDNVSSAVAITAETVTNKTKDVSYLESKLPSTSALKSASSPLGNIEKISVESNSEEKKTSNIEENTCIKYQQNKSENNMAKEVVKLIPPKVIEKEEVKLIPPKTIEKEVIKLIPPTTVEKVAQKRRLSTKTTLETLKDNNEDPPLKKNIKCGVCSNVFSQVDWEDHVANQHNLIAWKAGHSINLDSQDLLDKLKQRLKKLGVLKCSMCNKETKKFKKFIEHVKICLDQKYSNTNKNKRKSRTAFSDTVTCGVCKQMVQTTSWFEHTGSNHDYLAWVQGEEVLNLEDESSVSQHLQNVIKANKTLICYKCGKNCKRVKLYFAHIKSCDGSKVSMDDSSLCLDLNSTIDLGGGKEKMCGICKQTVLNSNWYEHIGKEHNYLAWQDGTTPLDVNDEDAVWHHLMQIKRDNDGLTCYKCGLHRKQVKLYLSHIKTCDGKEVSMDDSSLCLDLNSTIDLGGGEEKMCGICKQTVLNSNWYEHIGKEHNYLAWQEGTIPLDVNDEDAVWQHLMQIKRNNDGLTCYKCGLHRKRVKLYLSHIKTCDGKEVSMDDSSLCLDLNSTIDLGGGEEKMCGICKQTVLNSNWYEHIGKEHNYLAWQEGTIPLDVNDEDAVWQHLMQIKRNNDGLTCYKCGLHRKQVKLYLSHIKTCDGKEVSMDDSSLCLDLNSTIDLGGGEEKMCGICKQTVLNSNWYEHIGKEHNYLAWQDGSTPLDVNDEDAVWQHLMQIKRNNDGLTCYKCGLHRKRVKLYLSHIKTCDGKEVAMDESSSCLNSLNTSKVKVEKENSCGVCKQTVSDSNWVEHIGKEHNYLAWQEGDTPLDLNDADAVWQHLQQIIRYNDGLICYKCGLHRKRVKLYLAHVKTCDGSERHGENSANTSLDFTTWYEVPIVSSDEKKIVKCGVCNQEVTIVEWIQHIGKEHNYLAWRDGSPPLDLEDELTVREHLLNISRYNAGLICSKCDKNIKYPKIYLQHIRECMGITISLDYSKPSEVATSSKNFRKNPIKGEIVTCGVCQTKTDATDWMNHMEKVHQYLAWMDGETPIDLSDPAAVHSHLYDVSRMLGGLKCLKCGVRRKYVKTYLTHIETCDGNTVCSNELSVALMSQDIVQCALCAAQVKPKDWRDHAMKKHYNIAWVVGDIPIEVNSPYLVESYLKEYLRKNNKLVCKVCGISRASCVGFYAHIIQCGKTEQETEIYKSVCDICNNKYLRIYKSQHMTMHKEQELAIERKLLVAKEKELKKEEPEIIIQSGRRKAAEKAKTVLEKYKTSINEGQYHCPKCGFSSEIEKELTDHVCVEEKWGNTSDSDESVNLEGSEDESEDETDVDSNISDEEHVAREEDSHKKRRYSDNFATSTKVSRLPYQVKSITTYMKKSAEEFAKTYLTDEDIFPQWHNCEIEAVSENDVSKYMPPMEESCQVKFDDNDGWKTFNRFETKRETGDTIIMFVGASIQSMSWVPAHSDNSVACRQPQYMAVVCHLDSDVPRYTWDTKPSAHGLIQIWDCGNLISCTPQFVLGVAHDFGTVWSIDWCPSGARDAADFEPKPNKIHRLGLLAAACSNGSAYIFSVPYPSSITEGDKVFYKLQPVAELRLAMSTHRKCFQATAIKWSTQKGHSNVVVGYADGTTAFYDLNGESPLLKTTENNMTVFYPYHDERVQNACIEDVDLFPSACPATGVAGQVVCAASVGGSSAGAGAGALQSHVPSARALFPPHWPAPLLAGDDCLVNQSINEMEWCGVGRRLGGMRGVAGCAWCGRVAAAALPLLRLMRLHPCFPEVHKQVIGTIQMTHLGSKRKQQTDELAMLVEPITYSDCVKKYGLEFKQITARDRSTQQKLSAMPRDAYPERFPLNDVTAMQFCPTFKYHHKLAVAMHAGVIFILNV